MLSAVPVPIQAELRNVLHSELASFSFTGGGCINHGGKLTTTAGQFFLKWNDGAKLPAMFHAEAKGLHLLKSTNVIAVPNVITSGVAGPYQFLLLEWINTVAPHKTYWKTLGHQLASLHRISSVYYGLDHDNFIGSLPQHNSHNTDWI